VIHSGKFLYNNYKQALDLIKEHEPFVLAAQTRLNLSDEDIERMGVEEQEYIEAMQQGEREELNLKCSYLEALEKLWDGL
jgi:hypothetical protein